MQIVIKDSLFMDNHALEFGGEIYIEDQESLFA